MNLLRLPTTPKALLGVALLLLLFLRVWEKQTAPPLPPAEPAGGNEQLESPKEFLAPNLVAKSALIYDMATDRFLFEQTSLTPLPTASLGKVMTALLATENLPATSTVTFAGDVFPLRKLINLTLLASINDGAEALAAAVAAQTGENFITLMNRRAADLGLRQTFFLDASGLDWSTNFAGGYSSARDLAHLFAHIIKNQPALLEATKETGYIIKSATGQLYYPANTNKAVSQIPDLLASKTGSTDLAGGNLVTVFDRGLNQPVVAVILGSTLEARFSDMTALTRAAMEHFAN